MTAPRSLLLLPVLSAAILTIVLGGCTQSDTPPSAPPSQPVPQASAPPGASEEEIERLRSLGYLDSTGLPKLGAGRGVRVLDAANACPGYTLVVFAGTCTAQLMTFDGQVVRTWKDEHCHRWEHAELLPGGDLVVVGARLDEDKVEDPIETGRYIRRLSWKGDVVWNADINAHHDVSPTSDGKLWTLVMKRRRIPALDPDDDVADDFLTLMSEDGKVVESFSLYEILASSKIPFAIQKAGGGEAGRTRLLDVFHTNAIRPASVPALAGVSPIYGPSAVIITSRHQDEIMIVDGRARQLLWHWGRGVLSGPHEASVLANGRILVFDNGLSRGWSRVLDLNPLAPRELTQFAPGPSRFFSRVMGSCQRLPNGNTLIVHSEGGAAFELTPKGQPAWTYEGTQQTPDGHRVKLIRMRRIPSAIVDAIIARRGR